MRPPTKGKNSSPHLLLGRACPNEIRWSRPSSLYAHRQAKYVPFPHLLLIIIKLVIILMLAFILLLNSASLIITKKAFFH